MISLRLRFADSALSRVVCVLSQRAFVRKSDRRMLKQMCSHRHLKCIYGGWFDRAYPSVWFARVSSPPFCYHSGIHGRHSTVKINRSLWEKSLAQPSGRSPTNFISRCPRHEYRSTSISTYTNETNLISDSLYHSFSRWRRARWPSAW